MTRIDKLLSSRGYGSRKVVRAMIKGEQVKVNSQTVTDPATKIDIDKDRVVINDKELKLVRHIYIMLNKPAGVLCVSRDKSRKTVIDLLPPDMRWRDLFPAGRLDKDTEGFVIITDDGDFAHRMLAPKKQVSKTYEAIIDKPVSQSDITAFQSGLVLSDGTICLPAQLKPKEEGSKKDQHIIQIVLHEGKYHQIKRMLSTLGHNLLYLKRTKIGQVELDSSLEKGQSRLLTEKELLDIFN